LEERREERGERGEEVEEEEEEEEDFRAVPAGSEWVLSEQPRVRKEVLQLRERPRDDQS
jgi:hypothetical protein